MSTKYRQMLNSEATAFVCVTYVLVLVLYRSAIVNSPSSHRIEHLCLGLARHQRKYRAIHIQVNTRTK